MAMLIKNELYKASRQKMFYMIILIALAIEIAVALQGKFGADSDITMLNGQRFPLLLIDDFSYLFIVFVAVFIADTWVDEYRSGSFKLSLLRSVNRTSFLSSKVISLFVCSAILIFFTLLSAFIVGTLAFGWGDDTGRDSVMLALKSGLATLFPVLGFGLLVLFIAILTDSKVATISGALGLTIVSQILEESAVLRDYSIVYLIRSFDQSIIVEFPQRTIPSNVPTIAGYIAAFYLGSIFFFRRKDLVA